MDGLKDKARPWDLDLSIVIPLKDEDQSVLPLKNVIDGVMQQLRYSWECLWIDDGSTDNTLSEIQRFHRKDPHHQYIALASSCGQSAALHAGFSYACGEIIATLDGDGQNDPGDLPGGLRRQSSSCCRRRARLPFTAGVLITAGIYTWTEQKYR